MKVSPVVPSAPAPEAPAQVSVRSFKMNTNATPGKYDTPAQVEDLPPAQNLSTPDTNEVKEPEATEPLSPQFAALAKQRRALQQERRAFDDEKKAFEASRTDVIDKAQFKADPLGVMLAEGFTFDDLAKMVIARQDGISPKVQSLEQEIKNLKDGFDQKLTERDQQAKQQALAEMQREALALTKDGDDFALVRETKSVPKVMQLIERTYDKTGEVLDVKEACQLVETELLAEAEKLSKLQKVQAKAQPPAPPAQPQQRPAGMRTLTNRDTAQMPMSAKQRAMLAFHGQLNK